MEHLFSIIEKFRHTFAKVIDHPNFICKPYDMKLASLSMKFL